MFFNIPFYCFVYLTLSFTKDLMPVINSFFRAELSDATHYQIMVSTFTFLNVFLMQAL